jgi:hypothetical protein
MAIGQASLLNYGKTSATKTVFHMSMCRFPCPVLFPSSIAAKLDLALGEIGVSADRERKVDFTQPFLVTTMAVAVLKDTSFANWRQILWHHAPRTHSGCPWDDGLALDFQRFALVA